MRRGCLVLPCLEGAADDWAFGLGQGAGRGDIHSAAEPQPQPLEPDTTAECSRAAGSRASSSPQGDGLLHADAAAACQEVTHAHCTFFNTLPEYFEGDSSAGNSPAAGARMTALDNAVQQTIADFFEMGDFEAGLSPSRSSLVSLGGASPASGPSPLTQEHSAAEESNNAARHRDVIRNSVYATCSSLDEPDCKADQWRVHNTSCAAVSASLHSAAAGSEARSRHTTLHRQPRQSDLEPSVELDAGHSRGTLLFLNALPYDSGGSHEHNPQDVPLALPDQAAASGAEDARQPSRLELFRQLRQRAEVQRSAQHGVLQSAQEARAGVLAHDEMHEHARTSPECGAEPESGQSTDREEEPLCLAKSEDARAQLLQLDVPARSGFRNQQSSSSLDDIDTDLSARSKHGLNKHSAAHRMRDGEVATGSHPGVSAVAAKADRAFCSEAAGHARTGQTAGKDIVCPLSDTVHLKIRESTAVCPPAMHQQESAASAAAFQSMHGAECLNKNEKRMQPEHDEVVNTALNSASEAGHGMRGTVDAAPRGPEACQALADSIATSALRQPFLAPTHALGVFNGIAGASVLPPCRPCSHHGWTSKWACYALKT